MKQMLSTMALAITHLFCWGQNKNTYTLQEAIDFAITNNYVIKSSQLDQKLASARTGEVRAAGLPQINGNADLIYNINNQRNILENGIGFTTRTDIPLGAVYSIQLGLKNQLLPSIQGSQVLFDLALFNSVSASKTYQSLAEKNVTRTKIDIALAVTKAYYAVLVNEKQLSYIEANLARTDSMYQQTKAEFENGLARTIDVDRREVSLNNLNEERIRVTNQLDISKALLKFQMNHPDTSKLLLTTLLDENLLQEAIQASKEKVDVQNRIEYSILNSQAKLNSYDTRAARGSRYPRLLAIGAIGYNPGASEFTNLVQRERWLQYSYLGLRLQVPILAGFSSHYRVQQRRLQEDKTSNDKKLLERQIALEADQAYINFQNNIQSLNTQKRNLQLAERTLELLRAEHEEGLSTTLDVTVAETDLRAAQNNYYNALFGALVSKADYQKATGNLLK